jgi:hypothetical protein
MRKAVLLSLTLMAGAIPGYAQQAQVTPQSNSELAALRQSGNPYSKLFDTRHAVARALLEQAKSLTPAPKRTVVCGMTMIEAAPSTDPKMGVSPRKDEKTRFTIRAVEPPICK